MTARLLSDTCVSRLPLPLPLRGPFPIHPIPKLRINHPNTCPSAIFLLLLSYHVFIFFTVTQKEEQDARETGLEIVVAVQTKGGSPKRFKASNSRSLDYTTWHKIALRI